MITLAPQSFELLLNNTRATLLTGFLSKQNDFLNFELRTESLMGFRKDFPVVETSRILQYSFSKTEDLISQLISLLRSGAGS